MNKLQLQKVPTYYQPFIDLVNQDHLLMALQEEQSHTRRLIAEIPPEKADFRYDTHKWSVKEVLMHLIDTERIMAYRALCFARGESVDLPGFDQENYTRASLAEKRDLTSIQKEYLAVRDSTIALFEHLDDGVLQNQGIANGMETSVLAIGFLIVGHEIHHRRVIWRYYLQKEGL